jgi:archaellum biogenesis ATPase FlaH
LKNPKQDKKETSPVARPQGNSRPNLIAGMELEEFLAEDSKYRLKIEKTMEELGSSFSLLLTASPSELGKAKTAVLKRFAREKGLILYITFNQSASKIISELSAKGIDATKVFVIDMVSKDKGYEISSAENISDFDSPTQLTDLLLALEEKMSSKEKPSLMFDSISTLLVYNDKESAQKFLHSLVAKVHKADSRIVLLASNDSATKDAFSTISQFCDRFYELE